MTQCLLFSYTNINISEPILSTKPFCSNNTLEVCGMRLEIHRNPREGGSFNDKSFNYLLITHTFHCGGARHCGPVTADSVRFQMCPKPRVNVGKSSGGSCSLCWWWFGFGAICSCWHLSYEKCTITSSCWYRWWSKSSAEGFLTLKNANTLFPSKCRMSQIWRYMYPLIGRYFQKPINRRILCQ